MPEIECWTVADEQAMRDLGAKLSSRFAPGDIVLLDGELGAGKTTLVRGILAGLGWHKEVRSPTFNLMHEYATTPPVLHADLFRVSSATGIGLEDYLESHICFVEWPDRLGTLVSGLVVTRIVIEFVDPGRRVTASSSG